MVSALVRSSRQKIPEICVKTWQLCGIFGIWYVMMMISMMIMLTIDVRPLWQDGDRPLCRPLLVSHLGGIVFVFVFICVFLFFGLLCLCHLFVIIFAIAIVIITSSSMSHHYVSQCDTGCIFAPQESDPIQKNFPMTPFFTVASSSFLCRKYSRHHIRQYELSNDLNCKKFLVLFLEL